MKKALSLLLVFCIFFAAFGVVSNAADDFDSVLASFPDSYRASLTQLHKAHPNWKFEKLSVGKDFSVCLDAEHNCKTKLNLVEVGSATDSKACPSDCKNAAYHNIVDGVYRCASKDYIAECMDPTNSLRESLIFQFEYLGAKAYYTKDKLETALSATSSFMQNKTYRTTSATYYYSQIILDACKANGIDALFIISRITNEIGSASPAKLAKGYEYEYEKGKTKTVYNFFNIGGNVSGSAAYAYNHGWTNPKAALEGGIKFIAQNYLKAGQDTNYFQKFQVNPDCVYGFYEHQYMQGVDAVINESSYTFNNYSKLGIVDKEHTFKIPVYKNLSSVSYEAQDLSFRNAALSEKFAFVNSNVSSGLNIRKEPNTSSGKVCQIKKATLLQIIGKSGAWYQVKVLSGDYKDKKGYCHGDYVSPAQKISLTRTTSVKLEPKLRTSTCSYSLAYSVNSGAVTVDKNATASGKKVGVVVYKAVSSANNTCYIELECTPLIGAPSFTVSGAEKKITISWKAVTDAKSYKVYRYDSAKKSYTTLANTTALSYTDTGLSQGTEYTYLVRAVDMNGACSVYTVADNKSALTLPAKPDFKLSGGTNTVSISWAKVKGAEAYGIWSYNTSTGKYSKLANTTALGFKVNSLSPNKSYTYIVRSYNSTGWSRYSTADNKSVKTAPAIPAVTVKGGEKKVALSWQKCAGASYYIVYRYNPDKKSYSKLSQTSALSYSITKLGEGTEYIYLVRAFNSAGTGSSYSASNQVKALTLSAKPVFKLSPGSESVTLSWSKVKGAQKYGIWAYDTASKTYKKLANTTALSYKVGSLSPNKSYTYLVRSGNDSGWSKYTAADNKSVKTAPKKVSLSVNVSEKAVGLLWKASPGAVEYRVYSFDPQTGKFTKLSSVKTTQYTDLTNEDLEKGYLVRAVNASSAASDYAISDVVYP